MIGPNEFQWEDAYVDDGETREQDNVRPGEFAKMKDRAPLTGRGSPFFSGRELEINEFRNSAGQLAKGITANNTLVFEGPPGCGKSALLDQITADINSYSLDRNGRDWVPVFIDGADATNPHEIMESVDAAIATKLARRAVAGDNASMNHLKRFLGIEQPDGAEKLKRAADMLVKRGFRFGGFQIGPDNEAPPQTIAAAIRQRAHKWDGWNIVLLIDEAQQIHAPPGKAKTSTLSSMHQGKLGAPIMFAAFGLVGTEAALDKVGVSRTSLQSHFSLKPMPDDDTRKVCQRAAHQLKPKEPQRLATAIVERSCGWPQHIASYLTALARNPEQDTEAVLAQGDQHRLSYYQRRLAKLGRQGPGFRSYAEHLAHLLRGANQPMRERDIMESLRANFEAGKAETFNFLVAAEHCGLVRLEDNGSCSATIPSFVTHLTGEGGPFKQHAQRGGQVR